MSVHHDVMRFAQRFGHQEWPHGLSIDGRDAGFWAERGCGVACLRMIVHFFTGRDEAYAGLLAEGVAQGAYGERGWIHAGLAAMAQRRGLMARACAIDGPDELRAVLLQGPVIASVTLGFPEDGRRGGHLVVACGFDAAEPRCIHVRDPARWGESNASVGESRFLASFSGRVIRFAAPGAASPWRCLEDSAPRA